MTTKMAEAVQNGLAALPKRLPPWLFYDAAGSELFERITRQPEYYPTGTEREMLETHGEAILDAAGGGPPGPVETLVELGSGSSSKTGILIDGLRRRRAALTYVPIDVSSAALALARTDLEARYPGLEVCPITGTYDETLPLLAGHRPRRLVLFLGSSLGNFDPPEAAGLLRRIRAALAPGDALLLGLDLVKPLEILLPAYDDAQGVTAHFNLNLLDRLNRELGANFDRDGFRHRALWNPASSRVEMHLESTASQEVAIEALNLRVAFKPGERLHTESSYKFRPEAIRELLEGSGWSQGRQWMDPRDWFSLTLAFA